MEAEICPQDTPKGLSDSALDGANGEYFLKLNWILTNGTDRHKQMVTDLIEEFSQGKELLPSNTDPLGPPATDPPNTTMALTPAETSSLECAQKIELGE